MTKDPIRVAAGKKSKRKGGRGNREAYKLFHRWFPDACKGDQSIGGAYCPDIDRTPWWIEVKFYAHLYPSTWANAWNSANRDMGIANEKDLIHDIRPVLVLARSNFQHWYVLATAEHLYELGYRGANSKFQHPNLVDGEDLRRITWGQFQELIDNNYPIQQELV